MGRQCSGQLLKWLHSLSRWSKKGLGLSEAAARIRKTDVVALPGGPRKGQAASKINCF